MQTLLDVGKCLTTVPDDYDIHKDVLKLLQSRKKMLESGEGGDIVYFLRIIYNSVTGITMAFAESLAFGCLMRKFSPLDEEGLR